MRLRAVRDSAALRCAGKVYNIYRMLEPKPKELLDNPRRHFVKEGPVILWNEVERKKKDRVRGRSSFAIAARCRLRLASAPFAASRACEWARRDRP